MKLFDNIRNYIGEDDFRIIIYKDKINVINFKNINEITSNKVLIDSLSIYGKNLSLNKIMTSEVLINGIVEKIEFDE
ncbi:MAG: hypothetical protein IKE73_01825 [Bacilli bacterium]|nr:hypothetical protein [Bacilli bacterium]